jgi:hypothetical protein
MSRFTIPVTQPATDAATGNTSVLTVPANTHAVVYGYDRILRYYFVDLLIDDPETGMEWESLVGEMSQTYGSAHNCLECLDNLGVTIPQQHRDELILDLPLTEVRG